MEESTTELKQQLFRAELEAEKYFKLLKPQDYGWAKQCVYPIWFELLLDMTIGQGIKRVSVMQLITYKIKYESKLTFNKAIFKCNDVN